MELFRLMVAVIGVSVASAFFFRSGTPVATADDREVEESCLALADAGSCDFYTCFERRLPCGREWYILKTGHYYCNKMQRHKNSFTPEGQTFIDDAQRCLTQSLKEVYRREYIDCHTLEHQAIESISTCFIENDFCDVLQANADKFFRVYEFSDLFTQGAGKVWRQIVSLATRCGEQTLRQVSSGTIDRISTFFNSLTSSSRK
ncbi:stanniocalcin-2-like [Physella acuta]|uniref:stanniocalcin-2-like n=1 Tax=Physella acuta TaxID=109671 RepID=UPI0027DBCEF2|nr:stanniocalcin-2-like [Physella acuta]